MIMKMNNLETREQHLTLQHFEHKIKGVQIDVEHVTYSVQAGKGRILKVLEDVSFKMLPCTLTALMGPSGAGKSTLLDLLADRKIIGEWSGDIFFNNGLRSNFFFRDSAYIVQDDLQIATLTVRETIYFAASFKMPEGTTRDEINRRVDLLLELMSLTHIHDSFVGDATHRGISGGQLKRLSIAVEMVSLPYIVFLDEPTSGLDSTMALDVMQTVRRLTEENRTCIATIHQPSPEVFALFDYVVLLSEGQLIYFGTTQAIETYFCQSSLHYTWEIEKNPAEFLIEVSDGLLYSSPHTTPYTAKDLKRIFDASKHLQIMEIMSLKERLSNQDDREPHTRSNETPITSCFSSSGHVRIHATTKFTQFQLLLLRSTLANWRDKDETYAHFAKNIAIGLFFGILFYGQASSVSTPLFDTDGIPTSHVSDVCSLLFLTLLFMMLSNIQAIPHLLSRNRIFRREIASCSYAVSAYWLAHTISVIPLQLIGYTLFLICNYFLIGYPTDVAHFGYFYTVIILGGLSTYYYAMLLAAIIPKETAALEVFSMLFLLLSAFAGYAITIDDIPVMWIWASYIDIIRWGFEGLMVNQWENYDDDSTGQNVLSLYNFDNFDKFNTLWILGIAILFFVICVYFAIRPPMTQLKKIPHFPTTTAETTTMSPLVHPTHSSNILPDEEEMVNQEGGLSFSAETPRFKDGLSLCAMKRNSVLDAPKIAKEQGYHLTFHNISYSVDSAGTTSKGGSNTEPLKILNNISGRIEPKELCALMGPSGAGKSTLLDILADRKTIGTINGNIYINGHIRSPPLMHATAYVMQDAAHFSYLTVRETLEFAANFRMSQEDSPEIKQERIRDLLSTLRLDQIADSYVGNEEVRGISGGQRRRLSIGVEIIHVPKMIFLDEPTTGLDSVSANEVISVIRILANRNITILCTIHQPSATCFALFDKVLLLSQGVMIYFGAVASMKEYFMTGPYQFPHKPQRNVAEYMMDIASGSYLSGTEHPEIITIPQLVDGLEQSSLYAQLQEQIPLSVQRDKIACPLPSSVYHHPTTTGCFCLHTLIPGGMDTFTTTHSYQIKMLLYRLYLQRIRNIDLLLAPLGRSIVVGILYGTIFFQLDTGNNPIVYTDRLSLFFFTLMFLLMPHLDDMAELQQERPYFYRERSSRTYSVFAYWCSRLLVTMPMNMIGIVLYTSVMYSMCSLRDSTSNGGGMYLLYFITICILSDSLGHLLAQLISNVSSSLQVASSIFPIFAFFLVGFEGFIIYLPTYPEWISWIGYFSYLRYAFEGLVINEFSSNDQLPLSSTYLHNLGFDTLQTGHIFLILISFFLVMSILSYLTLYYIRFERR